MHSHFLIYTQYRHTDIIIYSLLRTCTYKNILTHVHLPTHSPIHTHSYTNTLVLTVTYIYIYIYIYVYIYIYIYKHAHLHTWTSACTHAHNRHLRAHTRKHPFIDPHLAPIWYTHILIYILTQINKDNYTHKPIDTIS